MMDNAPPPAALYAVRDGAAWITLNRPRSRNALSAELVNALYAHVQSANADAAVRAIVVTGAEPAFCAGADLKSPPGATVEGYRSVPLADVLGAMLESPKPVIAAVNGAAYGGGLGLIGAADIAIAADTARFSFSEVRLGVVPADVSVVCIPKLGVHRAMRLFLTGTRFDAAEAVQGGLVHRAVPHAELKAAVRDEVEMIRRGGPNAVVECKKLVRSIAQLPPDEGFRVAGDWSSRLFHSDEAAEGMAAFREKRDPAWIGGGRGEDGK